MTDRDLEAEARRLAQEALAEHEAGNNNVVQLERPVTEDICVQVGKNFARVFKQITDPLNDLIQIVNDQTDQIDRLERQVAALQRERLQVIDREELHQFLIENSIGLLHNLLEEHLAGARRSEPGRQ
jgi:polyhydroxyalkanoate synthesis regulator phasin